MTAALTRASAPLTRRPLTIAVPLLLLVATVLPTVARTVSRSMTWVTESRLTRGVSLRLFRLTIATRLIAIALAAESVSTLTDREVGRLSLWRLPLGTGKRGPDQGTMDGPLVVRRCKDRFFDVCRFRRFLGFHRLRRKNGLGFDDLGDGFLHNFFSRHQDRWLDGRRRRRDRFLPSWRWNLSVLVLVLGVARGAACPLHLVFNHRDDRVVSDATLARTVIV